MVNARPLYRSETLLLFAVLNDGFVALNLFIANSALGRMPHVDPLLPLTIDRCAAHSMTCCTTHALVLQSSLDVSDPRPTEAALVIPMHPDD